MVYDNNIKLISLHVIAIALANYDRTMIIDIEIDMARESITW